MTAVQLTLFIFALLHVSAAERGNKLPEPGECGIDSADRVFGGRETKIDEFPWLTLMKYFNAERNKTILMCGGSIINSWYVVTAAHCVDKVDLPGWEVTHVRVGEWKISTDPDCIDSDATNSECVDPVKDYEVAKSVVHEGYVPNRQQHHDIALLRLREEIVYSYFVKPICLPTMTSLKDLDYSKKTLTVAGWGTTEVSAQSDVKLKVELPGVTLDFCQDAFEGKTITGDQICAGAERGRDSCTGDSGGPLMATSKTSKGQPFTYLVGTVSYGHRTCGKKGKPGVYIRVSRYLDWITSNLEP